MIVFLMLLSLYPSPSTGVANLKHYETLSHIDVRTNMKRASDGSRSLVKQLRLQVFLREFDVTLQPNTGLLAQDFRVHLIHGDGSSSHFHFDHNQIFSGHLTDRPDVRVRAHREENLWSIQIFDHNDTYSIEPAWRLLTPSENPRNDTLIAYRASDLTSNSFNSSRFCGVRDHVHGNVTLNGSLASKQSSHLLPGSFDRKRIVGGRDKRRTDSVSCSLYLVGDYTFLSSRCRRNYVTCTAIMFSYVDQTMDIYKQSVFEDHYGQKYNGIQLEVGQIYLYTSYTQRMDKYPHPHFNEDRSWSIDQKLDAFSLYVSYLTLGESFCAHHLFSDYPFPDRILGLAWMSSICTGYGSSVAGLSKANSGVSSGTDSVHGSLPTLQMSLVFAHGHSFGSEHDPNTAECSRSDSDGGNFLMWSASVSGHLPNNFKFSPCSLRLIGNYLQENKCFMYMELVPSFCGNGVVEEAEVCDAGVYGMVDKDNCCSQDCQLRPHAFCSEKNIACCQNCTMAPANTECWFSDEVECMTTSYCTGSSFVCPQPLPVADWTACRYNGQCYRGRCRNFCEVKSIKEGLKLKECFCRSNVDNAACKLCCFDATDNNNHGPCLVHSNITVSDGVPCFLGYCEMGVCMESSSANIHRLYGYLSEMHSSTLEIFLKANIVLIVVVVSLLLCLPPVYFISRADKREAMQRRKWRRLILAIGAMDTEVKLEQLTHQVNLPRTRSESV